MTILTVLFAVGTLFVAIVLAFLCYAAASRRCRTSLKLFVRMAAEIEKDGIPGLDRPLASAD
jgi:hypothetical protein